jgi:hypothetical protein
LAKDFCSRDEFEDLLRNTHVAVVAIVPRVIEEVAARTDPIPSSRSL